MTARQHGHRWPRVGVDHAVIGLLKTELVRRHGSWRSFGQLELATARWVDWYNNRRLHSAIDDVPPAEFEPAYYARSTTVDAS